MTPNPASQNFLDLRTLTIIAIGLIAPWSPQVTMQTGGNEEELYSALLSELFERHCERLREQFQALDTDGTGRYCCPNNNSRCKRREDLRH